MTDHTPHDTPAVPVGDGTDRDIDTMSTSAALTAAETERTDAAVVHDAPHGAATSGDALSGDALSEGDAAIGSSAQSEPVLAERDSSASATGHAQPGAGGHGAPAVVRDARTNASYTDEAAQTGIGPFSIREVALLGVWAIAFLVSFFRTNILDSPSGVLVGGVNVWSSGLWWIPAVALPTAAVGLIVLRRLSPSGIRRVGSLGIDQFASVAFSISAFVWLAWVWDTVAVFDSNGVWTRSWVIWVEAIVLLAGVVLTVAGPWVRPFSLDFRGREEVPAHRNARPIRPVVPRPRAARPVPVHTAGPHTTESSLSSHDVASVPSDGEHAPGSYTGSTDLPHEAAPVTSAFPTQSGDHNDTDVFAPLRDQDRDAVQEDERRHGRDDTENHGHTSHHAQAFWALAPVERDVVDDYGSPIFRVGPTAWALVVEDRGETFVIRHDDGRIGYLHDVSGVTRG